MSETNETNSLTPLQKAELLTVATIFGAIGGIVANRMVARHRAHEAKVHPEAQLDVPSDNDAISGSS